MAREVGVTIGSGIQPAIRGVPVRPDGSRRVTGIGVVVLNPEDDSAHGQISGTQQTVGTTASRLPPTSLAGRRSVSIYNTDNSAILYIGGSSDVTASGGYPIGPGAAFSAELGAGIDIWGVSTTDIDIRVLEVN